MPRPEELASYLAHSRAVQRTVRAIGIAGIVLALIVGLAAGGGAAGAVLALDAIVVGAGWWITAGHIADFERRISSLREARPRAAAAAPRSLRNAATAAEEPTP